ncbi:hypothetical protein F4778DRAFT_575172 [Xylariomycetidae sp. FL2044]|nr:hypothetical protein F4778DRAFT_575172 [Xylariomycetidae sp. FL2044]
MTSAVLHADYPSYCFHLSPTINRWCPLRAIDIHGLTTRPGFEGQDVYFALNHPMRWVRIVGVVVAIDEYHGRRIYTVDDSTGMCIECSLAIPKPVVSGHQKDAVNNQATGATKDDFPVAPTDIDIGIVVDVKGSITLFRNQKQIKIQKLQRIRSTDQEVHFWNKIRDFRKDVLSQPWVLDKKEVRRCKKLQQVEEGTADRRKRKERKADDLSKLRQQSRQTTDTNNKIPLKSTKGGPATARSPGRKAHVAGEYDALGL